MDSLTENPAVLVAVAVVAATMIMAYIRRLEGQIVLQAARIEEQGQRIEEQHQSFEERRGATSAPRGSYSRAIERR